MSLALGNLCLERNGRPVFQDVSFTCAPGEAVMLRGPNGAGKTTLLRTLGGFLKPSSGQAQLFGVSIEDRDAFQDNLAYAGHLDAIKAQQTVDENIKFWCSLYANHVADEAASMFDLNALRERLAGACSAGQKRRLGLARLFISGRKLWLMDEPTVALDAASRDRLSKAVGDHLKSGGMALIATHDSDLVDGDTYTLEPPAIRQMEPLENAEAFS